MSRIVVELVECVDNLKTPPMLASLDAKFGSRELRSAASDLLDWLGTPLHRPWELDGSSATNLQVVIEEIDELSLILEIVDKRLRFKEHVAQNTKDEIRSTVKRLHRPILMT